MHFASYIIGAANVNALVPKVLVLLVGASSIDVFAASVFLDCLMVIRGLLGTVELVHVNICK